MEKQNIKKCKICEKTFLAHSNRAEYCSDECHGKNPEMQLHVGETINNITINSIFYEKKKYYAICKCFCGKNFKVAWNHLYLRKTVSCGCYRKNGICKVCGKTFKRLNNSAEYCSDECHGKNPEMQCHVGEIINNITIDSIFYEKKKYYTICKCFCGKTFTTAYHDLLSGRTSSCNCNRASILLNALEKYCHDGSNASVLRNILTGKVSKNNTSGCTGVYWFEQKQKWRAMITFKGKKHYLGYYDKKEDAIAARKEAEQRLFVTFIEENPDHDNK